MSQNKRNFQKELDRILEREEDRRKTLLLHSCCAPCSSYVLEYLSSFFEITVLYYNPNIFPEQEYEKRVNEQEKLIEQMHTRYPVHMIRGRFDPREFYDAVRGLEQIPE